MLVFIAFLVLIFCSMFVQSLTGFGGPLLAMPIAIMLVGVENARPVVTVAAIIAATLVAVPRYRDINWKKLFIMSAVMMAGVIAGDLMLGMFNITWLLVFYGIVVLLIGGKRLLFPRSMTLPPAGQYCALGAAGIMQGMFTSGGSFLVLYAVEQIKEKREFRATVSAVWIPLNIYLLTKFAFTGVFTAESLKLSAAMILPELVAIWLAGRLADRLNQYTFLRITYAILTVSGVILIINSLV